MSAVVFQCVLFNWYFDSDNINIDLIIHLIILVTKTLPLVITSHRKATFLHNDGNNLLMKIKIPADWQEVVLHWQKAS